MNAIQKIVDMKVATGLDEIKSVANSELASTATTTDDDNNGH
jgi:hypothetical protein